ncbi:beta-N-acetylhexosaminidase [Terrarubrum flagellatum]|uniref:beta-N-acetylhexosaminidase n=1 Tax=Terrirubrum flagellatum TaxID=2895980 RepID=UPI0031450551
MAVSALIVGCVGPVLTRSELAFLREANPWGLILFRRNIESPGQVKELTDAFRSAVGRLDAPVLIDQEGGRVQRLGPPHWRKYPPGAVYGKLRANDPLTGREIARLGARLIAHDLKSVGITVDCLPVLDVPIEGAHNVIGDRAYGVDPDTIAILGRAAAEGLLAGGVLPVIKHMPGHGRAGADSHEALPEVDTPLGHLETSDFLPFKVLSDMPLAMTAHVVYRAIDPDRPATTSKKVMRRIIRGQIGYDGLVMTDDLSMKALSGSFSERAAAAIKAGCDMLLHCNGDMTEMTAIASAAPTLARSARRRATAALARITHDPEPLDVVEARARFDAALATIV